MTKPINPSASFAVLRNSEDIEMEKLFEPPMPLEHATEVFDDNELASLREMEMTAEAVRRVRQNQLIRTQPPPDFDGENCTDCGLEIHIDRLALRYHTCIDCERAKEVRSKQFRQ